MVNNNSYSWLSHKAEITGVKIWQVDEIACEVHQAHSSHHFVTGEYTFVCARRL
jgi:hypothetical protein